jgi:bla regulator protein blaR1
MNVTGTKLPIIVLSVGLDLIPWIADAQAPDTRSTFEVVAITPSKPSSEGINIRSDASGTLHVENATLKNLIQFCYEVTDDRITGGPKWMDADRFDIAAKPETRSRPEHVLLMMQRLLADRFQLVLHRESKEARVYELVVAKAGPKLREPKDDQEPGLQGQKGRITARATPMAIFARYLSQRLGQPVVDKTGLPGSYDFTLQYEPDGANDAAAAGPSIFAALQEQLGLRLQPGKGPVDVLVVDRAEKPSDN